MLKRDLLTSVFRTASILRWNDYLLPIPLTELDKNAHKFLIACMLGWKREDEGLPLCWSGLIEACVFEFLRRTILTDIKRSVFSHLIATMGEQLNGYVCRELEPLLMGIAGGMFGRFREYFIPGTCWPVERRIARAASYLATRWEFERVVSPFNQFSPLISLESSHLTELMQLHVEEEMFLDAPMSRFLDVYAQLRFQRRWSQSPRVPGTSVLGHSLFVAVLMYFYSLKVEACPLRLRSNVLAGLLHDLPEALTRDIISPVKGALEGLSVEIRDYERNAVAKRLLPLLPRKWEDRIKFLLGYEGEDEFANRVLENGGQVSPEPECEHIGRYYQHCDAVDGRVLKVCDDLAALMEASMSMRFGTSTPDLEAGKAAVLAKYKRPKDPGVMSLLGHLERTGLLTCFDYFV